MGGRLDGTGSALAAWEDDAVDEAPFAVAAFEAAEEIDLSAPGCTQITVVCAVLSPPSYDRYAQSPPEDRSLARAGLLASASGEADAAACAVDGEHVGADGRELGTSGDASLRQTLPAGDDVARHHCPGHRRVGEHARHAVLARRRQRLEGHLSRAEDNKGSRFVSEHRHEPGEL